MVGFVVDEPTQEILRYQRTGRGFWQDAGGEEAVGRVEIAAPMTMLVKVGANVFGD